MTSSIMIKPKGHKFDFTIETYERTFHLFAATIEEKKKWLRALLYIKAEK